MSGQKGKTGDVHLVGAGPGDPELLTLRAARLIAGADAVVHDRLVSAEVLALAPPRARMIPVGKAAGHHSVPQERINEILAELALEGLDVVRLKGGDPFLFGRGSEEAAYLRARGIAVDVCPGITSAQGAAAETGVPLTHRGLATGVHYVTGHRQGGAPLDLDWQGLADRMTTLVVYMGAANIAEIAFHLMAAGRPGATPVLAVSGATTRAGRRHRSRLDRIGLEMRLDPLPSPVLFIIGEVVRLAEAAGDGAMAQLADAAIAGAAAPAVAARSEG
ncbi:MAG: uroporphyrinogen-III C-methyltransferase [Alphaproteobacteria bacterium]|nr:MAG: uroporphyrinogen-III C-methyltransferase [Alphaproteobacteria bacterium]